MDRKIQTYYSKQWTFFLIWERIMFLFWGYFALYQFFFFLFFSETFCRVKSKAYILSRNGILHRNRMQFIFSCIGPPSHNSLSTQREKKRINFTKTTFLCDKETLPCKSSKTWLHSRAEEGIPSLKLYILSNWFVSTLYDFCVLWYWLHVLNIIL